MSQGIRLGALTAAVLLTATALAQERRMDVTHKPETVFSQPVDQVAPALAGATPTNENGRVGGELVFWGYKLADGRPVFLFACAGSDTVSCDERMEMICVDRTTVLSSNTGGGSVVRRRCRSMVFVKPGDTRPGCVDNAETAPLSVGLVSCG
jgi:hypothetical protein